MKSSSIAIGCLIAFSVLILAWALWPSSPEEPETATATVPASPKPKPVSPPPLTTEIPKAEVPPVVPETPEAMTGVDREQRIASRCQELMDLAMMDDQASLKKIWGELSNPEKEIRMGAVDAIMQFGDRSKVKALREVAEKTDDPEEKAHIIAAADFLTLPPMNMAPGATQVDTPLPPQTPAP